MGTGEKTTDDSANMVVEVYLEVFKTSVYFFFGSCEYYADQLKRITGQECRGEIPGSPCAGHYYKYTDWQANENWHVVWVKNMDNAGTIAHECFHATTSVLDEIGVKYHSGDVNEVFAFVVGFLVKEVQRKINRHQKESE